MYAIRLSCWRRVCVHVRNSRVIRGREELFCVVLIFLEYLEYPADVRPNLDFLSEERGEEKDARVSEVQSS